MENIEIRTAANAAAALINPKDDMFWSLSEDSFFQNGTDEPLYVKTFIFNQIYDEFHHYTNYFDTRYKQYSQEVIQHFFKERMQTANNHFNYLQGLFKAYTEKYAIDANNTILYILEKLNTTNSQESYNKRDILMRAIIKAFMPLFDLNAFDRLMHHAIHTHTILFVSGFLHTQEVKKVMLDLKSTVTKTISTDIMHQLQTILSD